MDINDTVKKNTNLFFPWKRKNGNTRLIITRNAIKTALEDNCNIPADKIRVAIIYIPFCDGLGLPRKKHKKDSKEKVQYSDK